MSYNPLNPNGQATMANSSPVVIASDQSPVNVSFAAAGTLLTFHLVSASGNNVTVVKSSAGSVNGWYIYNNASVPRKIAFHNIATPPTVGAGVFMSLVIPANAGANVAFPGGISFSTGISITTTAGVADNDIAVVNFNDLIINIFYK